MEISRVAPSTKISEWSSSQSLRRVEFNGVSEGLAVSSPQTLKDTFGQITAGMFWFKTSGMTNAVQLYYEPSLIDSKPWVRVFANSNRGAATVNEINKNIPLTGLYLRQISGGSNYATGYWTSQQLFNTRNDTGNTCVSGTKSGYRVFFGYAGGMGFYNTSQQTCNWGDAGGAVGAGYNGTCGSFPNDLVMGLGASGSPYMAYEGGSWEYWLWWE